MRRLPALLAPRAVETLGFGLSGWGTLQALRAFEVMAPRYDVDLAVYVFVENDPGDNALALSEHRHDAAMPYAELADEPPGYRVREAPAARALAPLRRGEVGAGAVASWRKWCGCASGSSRRRASARPRAPSEREMRERRRGSRASGRTRTTSRARGPPASATTCCASRSASSPSGSGARTPRDRASPSSTYRAATTRSAGVLRSRGHLAPLAPRDLRAARRPAPRPARGPGGAPRRGRRRLRRPPDPRGPRRPRALPGRRAAAAPRRSDAARAEERGRSRPRRLRRRAWSSARAPRRRGASRGSGSLQVGTVGKRWCSTW